MWQTKVRSCCTRTLHNGRKVIVIYHFELGKMVDIPSIEN